MQVIESFRIRPVFRAFDETAPHRIQMNVIERFVEILTISNNVVVVLALPESTLMPMPEFFRRTTLESSAYRTERALRHSWPNHGMEMVGHETKDVNRKPKFLS